MPACRLPDEATLIQEWSQPVLFDFFGYSSDSSDRLDDLGRQLFDLVAVFSDYDLDDLANSSPSRSSLIVARLDASARISRGARNHFGTEPGHEPDDAGLPESYRAGTVETGQHEKPARGKCTTTSPAFGSWRRIAICCGESATISPRR